jgi:hypothetical protein
MSPSAAHLKDKIVENFPYLLISAVISPHTSLTTRAKANFGISRSVLACNLRISLIAALPGRRFRFRIAGPGSNDLGLFRDGGASLPKLDLAGLSVTTGAIRRGGGAGGARSSDSGRSRASI